MKSVPIIAILAWICVNCTTPMPIPVETEYHFPEPTKMIDTLTQWQALQLAIALTESRFNPDAEGTADDRGILQIRPIYVAEVNRITGENYQPTDAFDIEKSLEMFALLQDYHNPEHDIDRAIWLHNKSANYRRNVLDNLELIYRMERVRNALTK